MKWLGIVRLNHYVLSITMTKVPLDFSSNHSAGEPLSPALIKHFAAITQFEVPKPIKRGRARPEFGKFKKKKNNMAQSIVARKQIRNETENTSEDSPTTVVIEVFLGRKCFSNDHHHDTLGEHFIMTSAKPHGKHFSIGVIQTLTIILTENFKAF